MASKGFSSGPAKPSPPPPTFRPPTPGSNPLPSSRVGSFQNQQIGALNAGLSAPSQELAKPETTLGDAFKDRSSVAASTERQATSIKSTNSRLNTYAQAAAKKRAAQRAAGPAQGVGGGQPVGAAYRPDGTLSDSRNQVLGLASSYIGSPYRLGGTTTQGIDCSGLVKMVYAQLGYNLAHYVPTQAQQMPGVRTSVSNLRPGDLVVWADGSHIAIYAGNGQIIESQLGARSGPGVRRANLYTDYGPVYGIALRLPGE